MKIAVWEFVKSVLVSDFAESAREDQDEAEKGGIGEILGIYGNGMETGNSREKLVKSGDVIFRLVSRGNEPTKKKSGIKPLLIIF